MKSNEEIIAIAVERAQKYAQEHPFVLGQQVAHPSERLTCRFDGTTVKDGIAYAILFLPKGVSSSGKDEQKQFPMNECFDPNVAELVALDVKSEEFVSSVCTERS